MPEPRPAKAKRFGTIRFAVFGAAFLILVLQASASRALKIDEKTIGVPGLHDIPWQLGPWRTSAEGAMTAESAAVLKPDEYILRDYDDQQEGEASTSSSHTSNRCRTLTVRTRRESVCRVPAGW